MFRIFVSTNFPDDLYSHNIFIFVAAPANARRRNLARKTGLPCAYVYVYLRAGRMVMDWKQGGKWTVCMVRVYVREWSRLMNKRNERTKRKKKKEEKMVSWREMWVDHLDIAQMITLRLVSSWLRTTVLIFSVQLDDDFIVPFIGLLASPVFGRNCWLHGLRHLWSNISLIWWRGHRWQVEFEVHRKKRKEKKRKKTKKKKKKERKKWYPE